MGTSSLSLGASSQFALLGPGLAYIGNVTSIGSGSEIWAMNNVQLYGNLGSASLQIRNKFNSSTVFYVPASQLLITTQVNNPDNVASPQAVVNGCTTSHRCSEPHQPHCQQRRLTAAHQPRSHTAGQRCRPQRRFPGHCQPRSSHAVQRSAAAVRLSDHLLLTHCTDHQLHRHHPEVCSDVHHSTVRCIPMQCACHRPLRQLRPCCTTPTTLPPPPTPTGT